MTMNQRAKRLGVARTKNPKASQKDMVSLDEFKDAVLAFGREAKASSLMDKDTSLALDWRNLTEANVESHGFQKPFQVYFNYHLADTNLHEPPEFTIHWYPRKRENRTGFLNKTYKGADVRVRFGKFKARLRWMVKAIPHMVEKGILVCTRPL